MNPRTFLRRPAQGFKAHGFASPLFSGFALSRMKGVAIQARRAGLPPKPPQKLAASFATQVYNTILRLANPAKSF
jgi:hypothetical protein